MSDERLRELERRWRETGAPVDEVRFIAELIRALGAAPNGDANQYSGVISDFRRSVDTARLQELLYLPAEARSRILSGVNTRLGELLEQEQQANTPEPTGDYADEELPSNRRYPPRFRRKSIREQLAIWSELFPNLDASRVPVERQLPALPDGAEAWGVMPKPSVLGGYHEALREVVALLESRDRRQFFNHLEGRLTSDHHRPVEPTRDWLDWLENEQRGDYLVFPYQFGMRHRGRSIRRARFCFAGNEVGLSLYEVVCLLLTHPERMPGGEELFVDCAGSGYAPQVSGAFSRSVLVRWLGGVLDLHGHDIDYALGLFGSASAFRP